MSERLVRIAEFAHVMDAYLLKTRLEAAGIECFVADDITIGTNWLYSRAVGGVKVNVQESSVERALEILREAPVEAAAVENEVDGNNGRRCPSCDSTDVYYHRFSRRMAYATWLFLGFAFPFPRKHWKCFSCGHRWKAR